MSCKGNCHDNYPTENFFGLLKQGICYSVTYNSYEASREAIEKYIKKYIKYYNDKRIK